MIKYFLLYEFQPVLQNHQRKNKPEYIHQIAKTRLEAEGKLKSEEPETKKAKRPGSGSVSPLDDSVTMSPLPDLPSDLKQKQETLGMAITCEINFL